MTAPDGVLTRLPPASDSGTAPPRSWSPSCGRWPRTACTSARSWTSEGEVTAADRMSHQADVATFEAYLIAAAIHAGDHQLASVDLRWELARDLGPTDWARGRRRAEPVRDPASRADRPGRLRRDGEPLARLRVRGRCLMTGYVDATGALPPALLPALLGVLGLLIGSFLNVVVYRVPAGLSLVSPGSACPACAHPVRPRDNVPVVSWLLLGGRCRDCDAPISVRYPMVELATGLLFALTGVALRRLAVHGGGAGRHGRRRRAVHDRPRPPATAVRGHRRRRDRHRAGPRSWTSWCAARRRIPTALLSTAIWLAVYGGIWFFTAGRGMGLGDVALAPVLGLALGWLGWGASVVGLVMGFVIGAVVGVAAHRLRSPPRGTRVPHGPFLLSGAAVGLFVGAPLWTATCVLSASR